MRVSRDHLQFLCCISFQLDGLDNLVQLPKRGLQHLLAGELQQGTDVAAAGQEKEENGEERLCLSSQQTLQRKRTRGKTGRKNKDAQFSLQGCFFESEEPGVCRIRWKDANCQVWSTCPSWEERVDAAGEDGRGDLLAEEEKGDQLAREEGEDDRGRVEEICSSGRQVSPPPNIRISPHIQNTTKF